MRRKGARRSRGYGRRLKAYGSRARSIMSSPARMIGFRKDGFHVSDAIIVSGLAVTALMPATSAPESSAVGIMFGRGAYASQKLEHRAINALAAMAWTGLGVNKLGTTGNASTQGIGGACVGGGMAVKIAGKFVNPMMRGSAVKL